MKVDYDIALELLKYNLNENIEGSLKRDDINWINILGYLSYHRVIGLVYSKINNINVRLLDYPVFFSSYMIYEAQRIRTIEQQKNVSIISDELNKNNIKHVFLKGTILNSILFEYGTRASNDIDILINKKDINKVRSILNNIGFIQGKYDYKNNKIIEYSNDEINNFENNIGETAPFVKISNNPAIKTIDVDVNFSLDWKPEYNEETINNFLDKRILVNNKETGSKIYSLSNEYNFIELCMHFYKDAALIDLVKKRKVIDLYKIIDIYYFIMKYFEEINLEEVCSIIKNNNIDNEIFFTLKYINTLFVDSYTDKIKQLIENLDYDENIVNTIFDQYDNSIKMYTKDSIKDRIFTYDLIKMYEGD